MMWAINPGRCHQYYDLSNYVVLVSHLKAFCFPIFRLFFYCESVLFGFFALFNL